MYDALNNLVTAGGVALVILVCGAVIYAVMALEKGKPVLPWGPRSKVAVAKARVEIAELRIQEEAAEIKYLALQPGRNKVVKAIHDGEDVDLAEFFGAGKTAIPPKVDQPPHYRYGSYDDNV